MNFPSPCSETIPFDPTKSTMRGNTSLSLLKTKGLAIVSWLIYLMPLVGVHAQTPSAANYTFLTGTTGSLVVDMNGDPIDMSTGTTQLHGANLNVPFTAAVNYIGFPFTFMGQSFTQFSANPDGQIKLGATAIPSGLPQTAANASATGPIIGALNNDNKTSTTGKVHFKSANNVLIVEWKNLLVPNSGPAAGTTSTFQLRLYGATGIVELVYGNVYNSATTGTINTSIGFATGAAAGKVGQVTGITSATPVYNSTASAFTNNLLTNNAAVTNLTNRYFRFTPALPTGGASGLTFSAIQFTSMTLNWTDNASLEYGYAIFRKVGSGPYTLATTTAANATSATVTGLTGTTTYDWLVYAYKEGASTPAVAGTQATLSCTISGTKTIPGDYTSISDAIAAINANGLAGPVILSLGSGYTETGSVTIGNLPCASASNTLTIRPAAGATNVTITSAAAGPTVDLSGAIYTTIDGRAGGTGTPVLTISNTNNTNAATTAAVRFTNDAVNNSLVYTKLSATSTNPTAGVVVFGTGVASGNDNNTVDHCNINGAAGTTSNGFYSSGSTASLTLYNSDNSISNNSIYNVFLPDAASNGILLAAGNNNWTISANSFYQTAARTATANGSVSVGINITTGVTNHPKFIIANNHIGGAAPVTGAGGAPASAATWTMTGNFTNQFVGIALNAGANNTSVIHGNTITKFNWTSNLAAPTAVSGGSGTWTGIYLSGSTSAYVRNNTVGSTTGTGAITLTNTSTIAASSVASAFGILSANTAAGFTSPSVKINANRIGSVTALGFTGAITPAYTFKAISVVLNAYVADVDSNVVGSKTTANSINIVSPASTNQEQSIAGIYFNPTVSFAPLVNIRNNTVANMRLVYPGTSSSSTLVGIFWASPQDVMGCTISNNTVRALTANNSNTAAAMPPADMADVNLPTTALTTLPSVIGIYTYQAGSFAITINVHQNTIYGLSNTVPSGAVHVNGICVNSNDIPVSIINKNNVHSLSATSVSATVNGIYVFAGNAEFMGGAGQVYNNFVRLGIDSSGNSITTPLTFSGIVDAGGSNGVYFNSVYIGGTGVGISTSHTSALHLLQLNTDNPADYRGNALINARSNAAGGGSHYAVIIPSDPGNLTFDHNDYYAPGTGGVLGRAAGVDVTVLPLLSGQDANSISANPQFIAPTIGKPNLHITQGAPALDMGGPHLFTSGLVASPIISDDFDGEDRNFSTPDIGADEYIGPCPVAGTVTPSSSVVCSGGFKLFTLTGTTGGGIWQTSSNGISNWTDIPGATNSTYNLTGITTTRYIRFLSQSSDCYSISSNTAVVSVSATPVVTFTNVTSTSATVSWTPFGATQYNLSWTGAATGSQTGATSPFTISGLAPNTSLSVTVTQSTPTCAGTSAGNATTTTLCAKPTISSVTPVVSPTGVKGLKVIWTAVAGATAYRVYYRPLVMNANWSSVDVGAVLTTTVMPLYAGVPYAVMVAANNCPGAGQLGQPSDVNYFTYTAPGLPACGPVPTITAVSNCPNQLTANLSGGTGTWRVTARRLSPSFSAGVSYTVSSPVVNLSITATPTGSVWEVFAQAVCGSSYSGLSNVEVVTVKAPCLAPQNVVVSHPDCDGFTVAWNPAVCGGLTLSNYQVYIKKSTAVNYVSYNGGSGDHKTFPYPALAPGTYTVFVRAITCNGSMSAASTVETGVVGGPGCKTGDEETTEATEAVVAASIYPNPTAGQFSVEVTATSKNEALRIEVADALGRVVYTDLSDTEAGLPSLRVLNLPESMSAGLYTVRIAAGQNTWTERLILQRN